MSNKKPMGIRNPEELKKLIPDVKTFGNPDLFTLISKASSESQNWMKSTKAMETGNGVVVQVTTDINGAISDALTFVPDATIYTDETTGNKFIHAEQKAHKCDVWCDGDKPSDIENLLRNVTMLHEIAAMVNSEKYTMEYLMEAYNVRIPELDNSDRPNNKPFKIPSFNDESFDLSNCGVMSGKELTRDLNINSTGGEGFENTFGNEKLTDIETKHSIYININTPFLPKRSDSSKYSIDGMGYKDIIYGVTSAVKDLIVFDNEIKVNFVEFSTDRREQFLVNHSSSTGDKDGMDELVSEIQQFLNNAALFIANRSVDHSYEFKFANLHKFNYEAILSNAQHIPFKNSIDIGFNVTRLDGVELVNIIKDRISKSGLNRNNIITVEFTLHSMNSDNIYIIYGNVTANNDINLLKDIIDEEIKKNPELINKIS